MIARVHSSAVAPGYAGLTRAESLAATSSKLATLCRAGRSRLQPSEAGQQHLHRLRLRMLHWLPVQRAAGIERSRRDLLERQVALLDELDTQLRPREWKQHLRALAHQLNAAAALRPQHCSATVCSVAASTLAALECWRKSAKPGLTYVGVDAAALAWQQRLLQQAERVVLNWRAAAHADDDVLSQWAAGLQTLLEALAADLQRRRLCRQRWLVLERQVDKQTRRQTDNLAPLSRRIAHEVRRVLTPLLPLPEPALRTLLEEMRGFALELDYLCDGRLLVAHAPLWLPDAADPILASLLTQIDHAWRVPLTTTMVQWDSPTRLGVALIAASQSLGVLATVMRGLACAEHLQAALAGHDAAVKTVWNAEHNPISEEQVLHHLTQYAYRAWLPQQDEHPSMARRADFEQRAQTLLHGQPDLLRQFRQQWQALHVQVPARAYAVFRAGWLRSAALVSPVTAGIELLLEQGLAAGLPWSGAAAQAVCQTDSAPRGSASERAAADVGTVFEHALAVPLAARHDSVALSESRFWHGLSGWSPAQSTLSAIVRQPDGVFSLNWQGNDGRAVVMQRSEQEVVSAVTQARWSPSQGGIAGVARALNLPKFLRVGQLQFSLHDLRHANLSELVDAAYFISLLDAAADVAEYAAQAAQQRQQGRQIVPTAVDTASVRARSVWEKLGRSAERLSRLLAGPLLASGFQDLATRAGSLQDTRLSSEQRQRLSDTVISDGVGLLLTAGSLAVSRLSPVGFAYQLGLSFRDWLFQQWDMAERGNAVCAELSMIFNATAVPLQLFVAAIDSPSLRLVGSPHSPLRQTVVTATAVHYWPGAVNIMDGCLSETQVAQAVETPAVLASVLYALSPMEWVKNFPLTLAHQAQVEKKWSHESNQTVPAYFGNVFKLRRNKPVDVLLQGPNQARSLRSLLHVAEGARQLALPVGVAAQVQLEWPLVPDLDLVPVSGSAFNYYHSSSSKPERLQYERQYGECFPISSARYADLLLQAVLRIGHASQRVVVAQTAMQLKLLPSGVAAHAGLCSVHFHSETRLPLTVVLDTTLQRLRLSSRDGGGFRILLVAEEALGQDVVEPLQLRIDPADARVLLVERSNVSVPRDEVLALFLRRLAAFEKQYIKAATIVVNGIAFDRFVANYLYPLLSLQRQKEVRHWGLQIELPAPRADETIGLMYRDEHVLAAGMRARVVQVIADCQRSFLLGYQISYSYRLQIAMQAEATEPGRLSALASADFVIDLEHAGLRYRVAAQGQHARWGDLQVSALSAEVLARDGAVDIVAAPLADGHIEAHEQHWMLRRDDGARRPITTPVWLRYQQIRAEADDVNALDAALPYLQKKVGAALATLRVPLHGRGLMAQQYQREHEQYEPIEGLEALDSLDPLEPLEPTEAVPQTEQRVATRRATAIKQWYDRQARFLLTAAARRLDLPDPEEDGARVLNQAYLVKLSTRIAALKDNLQQFILEQASVDGPFTYLPTLANERELVAWHAGAVLPSLAQIMAALASVSEPRAPLLKITWTKATEENVALCHVDSGTVWQPPGTAATLRSLGMWRGQVYWSLDGHRLFRASPGDAASVVEVLAAGLQRRLYLQKGVFIFDTQLGPLWSDGKAQLVMLSDTLSDTIWRWHEPDRMARYYVGDSGQAADAGALQRVFASLACADIQGYRAWLQAQAVLPSEQWPPSRLHLSPVSLYRLHDAAAVLYPVGADTVTTAALAAHYRLAAAADQVEAVAEVDRWLEIYRGLSENNDYLFRPSEGYARRYRFSLAQAKAVCSGVQLPPQTSAAALLSLAAAWQSNAEESAPLLAFDDADLARKLWRNPLTDSYVWTVAQAVFIGQQWQGTRAYSLFQWPGEDPVRRLRVELHQELSRDNLPLNASLVAPLASFCLPAQYGSELSDLLWQVITPSLLYLRHAAEHQGFLYLAEDAGLIALPWAYGQGGYRDLSWPGARERILQHLASGAILRVREGVCEVVMSLEYTLERAPDGRWRVLLQGDPAAALSLWSGVEHEQFELCNHGELFVLPRDLRGIFLLDCTASLPLQLEFDSLPEWECEVVGADLVLQSRSATLHLRPFPRAGVHLQEQYFPDALALVRRLRLIEPGISSAPELQLALGYAHTLAGGAAAYDAASGTLWRLPHNGNSSATEAASCLGHLASCDDAEGGRLLMRMCRARSRFETPLLPGVKLYETVAVVDGVQQIDTDVMGAGGGMDGERDFLIDLYDLQQGQYFSLVLNTRQFDAAEANQALDPPRGLHYLFGLQQQARVIFSVPSALQLQLTLSPLAAGLSRLRVTLLAAVSLTGAAPAARARRGDTAAGCRNPPQSSRSLLASLREWRTRLPDSMDQLPLTWQRPAELPNNLLHLQQVLARTSVLVEPHRDAVVKPWVVGRRKLARRAAHFFAHWVPGPLATAALLDRLGDSPLPEQMLSTVLQATPGLVLGVAPRDPYAALQFVNQYLPELRAAGTRVLYIQSLQAELFQAELAAYFAHPHAGMGRHLTQLFKQKDDDLLQYKHLPQTDFRAYADTIAHAVALGIEVRCYDSLLSSVPNFLAPGALTSGRGQSQRAGQSNSDTSASLGVGANKKMWARLSDLQISHYLFQQALQRQGGASGKFVAVVGEAHLHTLRAPPPFALSAANSVPGLVELSGAFALRINPSNVFRDRVQLTAQRANWFAPDSAAPLYSTALGLHIDYAPQGPRSIAELALERSTVALSYVVLQADAEHGYELMWRSDTLQIVRSAVRRDSQQRWQLQAPALRSLLGATDYDAGYADRDALLQALEQRAGFRAAPIGFSAATPNSARNALASSLIGVTYLRASELRNVNLEGTDLSGADLRGIDWQRVKINTRTCFTAARFDRHSQLQLDLSLLDKIAELRDGQRERMLDLNFNHLDNPDSGSLLLAIDSIAAPHLRVAAMRALLTKLSEPSRPVELRPYLPAFADILLKTDEAYLRDPVIAQFVRAQVIPAAVAVAEWQIFSAPTPLCLRELLSYAQSDIAREGFLYAHNGLIQQLIVFALAAPQAELQRAAADLAEQYWQQLPLGLRQMAETFDRRLPQDLTALALHLRIWAAADRSLYAVMSHADLHGMLHAPMLFDAAHWGQIGFFGHVDSGAELESLSPRERSAIGSEEVIFNRFSLIGRIYSHCREKKKLIAFIEMLEFPESFKLDLIAAMDKASSENKHVATEEMLVVSERVALLMRTREHADGSSDQLLTTLIAAQSLALFGQFSAAPSQQGVVLFALAALLAHASSSSILGLEFDSPAPLRGLAAAYLNSAVLLNPALLPERATPPGGGNAWEASLLCRGQAFPCSGQVSSAMLAHVATLKPEWQRQFWKIFPLAWR
ncbi:MULTISPECIES: pentapeptide repeat-containing protein [unclassified Undibacterium]|uniref:pentapeptide repeat-containing protein n=2 Tax=Bacteria TaxID=2 RepID=UPI002AC9031C|nr:MULTISPECIES: pentapeptide repeat-containing protein [unclassified Undibacterium]MEB0139120.1 pentapeptide repeat-containing protein [Undibacterium sp. CCC2.1]MEB0173327.1 pentapeptide repeat-containing protein [Undibacterium sp. CCC1.1]MEB0177633.1 pentapeptide repeat-containing protein [Undibacterium sp. CCC3.4]MEB0216803.1 pentapeptide repeat-containing protein [Undibacterium sp. 5I2]WPX43115.1 pentapeptide repeat-containing protein [Undibacterium sp. CCC3.4]